MPQTIMRTSFKVKSLKVKAIRPITAETESVSYLRNEKAYTNFKIAMPMEHAINCHGQL